MDPRALLAGSIAPPQSGMNPVEGTGSDWPTMDTVVLSIIQAWSGLPGTSNRCPVLGDSSVSESDPVLHSIRGSRPGTNTEARALTQSKSGLPGHKTNWGVQYL